MYLNIIHYTISILTFIKLVCARYFSKSFTSIKLFNPHNGLERLGLLPLFYLSICLSGPERI